MKINILNTPRCRLRPFTIEDVESLTPILGCPKVMRYSMTGAMDLPTISSTINGWIALYKSHEFGPWAVVHQGQLIGYAGLDSRVIEGAEQVQITFRLAESHWGKGFATELAVAIRDYAFNNLGLTALVAIVDPENIASIQTISKIGMQFEKEVIYGGLSLHLYKIITPLKMHTSELNTSEHLVAKLISNQFPELTDLPIAQVKHYGTDNAIFRLGDEYAIRLPRVEYAVEQIEKEQIWLPRFVPHLPLTIPTPAQIGKPSEEFPHPWYVCHWIEGVDAYNEPPSDLNQVAQDLGQFIKAFWKIDTDGAPVARRGLPLITQDKAVREAISNLTDMIDTDTVTGIWQECLKVPDWNKPPVWLHADLLPPNLLLQNGKLHAIIDFGLMGIGDPACDLIPAWCLFDADARAIFKETLGIDENTWARGKGWALSIALIIMPYYKDTNPVLMSVARRIIEEITHDL